MTKKEIRKLYLAQRAALGQPEMHRFLANMLEQFSTMVYPEPQYILSYLPILERNEVMPHFFVETILDDTPTCQICYPRADFDTNAMTAIANDDDMETTVNQFGVTEPVHGNIVDKNLLDIIFVPLIAFDQKGYRVGYGKGFYDRFIPQCRPNVITIGLSFFDPVRLISDIGPFDVPLKYCITPQHLYEF